MRGTSGKSKKKEGEKEEEVEGGKKVEETEKDKFLAINLLKIR